MNDELIKREALIKRIDEHLVGLSLPCMESTDMAMLLKDCRAALLRSSEDKHTRYVPMTDAEWEKVMWTKIDKNHSMMTYEQFIEAAVIRRAGLEVSNER